MREQENRQQEMSLRDTWLSTPGPWEAQAGFVRTEAGAICSMARGENSVIKFAADPGSTEDASNAQLIAQAPSIRARLVSARATLRMIADIKPNDNTDMAELLCLAIAMAKTELGLQKRDVRG